jgi:peptidoglycan L-alanyl-D-glutamate endopeptidase CwlK
MNTASENRLKKVHPELAGRVRTLIEHLAANGMQVEVVQGLRTFAEQDALFAQGRTKPGQVVTRAKGGQSNHNYGLAVDLCPFTPDGKPNWNAPNTMWMAIGAEAEKLGLEWGGSWKKFIDKPHVQLPGLTIKQCSALHSKGGLQAVWAEASRLIGGGAPAAVATQPATGPVEERLLRRGDRGEDVRLIQTRLVVLGFIDAGNVDGIFGPGTEKAVKAFQKSKGLGADGLIGPQTRIALMSKQS